MSIRPAAAVPIAAVIASSAPAGRGLAESEISFVLPGTTKGVAEAGMRASRQPRAQEN
jgi:hypothetical protein